MQISIIDVGTPNTHKSSNGKREYQSIEVTYRDLGADKVLSKKIMSFVNPSLFKFLKELKKGDNINVTTVKDDNGYWQWTEASRSGEEKDAVAEPKKEATPTRVTGSNYETKEERAARQVMIVRQSSLSNAIATLAIGGKPTPSAEAVIGLAKEYEAYVLGLDEPVELDIRSDIIE